MNTQKYRLFKQLKNAIEADDILAATTRCIWDADGIAETDARCGVPSLQEIQTFTQPVKTDKRFIVGEDTDRYKVVLFLRTEDLQKNVLLTDEEKTTLQETLDLCKSIRQGNAAAQKKLAKDILPQVLKSICSQDDTEAFFKILNVLLTDKQKAAVRETLDLFKSACQGNVTAQKKLAKDIRPDDENFHHRFSEYISPKVIELIASGQLAHNESIERILSEIVSDRLSAFTNEFGTLPVEMFEPVANHLLRVSGEPSAERLEWLHQAWVLALEQDTQLSHPIVPLVRAWLQEQSAKRITLDYDKKHPGAVLKSPLGNVRNVIIFQANGTEKVGQLRGISAPAPESQQIELPGLEVESLLPAVLPLENVRMVNGVETTKRGAVAMPIRLFFEGLMGLDPKETRAEIHIKLGTLLHFLNPDGKYNRTNHLPYVLQGLHALYDLRIPYRENPDNPNTEVDWIPIQPRTVPNANSGDDASIILEVRLPPDARGGMMVEKEILRQTGKQSSAKFNAYLSACWIFDRYGTIPRGIIDPTKPAAQRDTEGYLTDGNGKRIFDDRGKPIKNRYHPRNIAAGERVDNEARERYPILSFKDLTRACFPKGFDRKKRATYQKRALKAWEELQEDNILRIEKYQHGWRILPSESHIGRHRALKKNVY